MTRRPPALLLAAGLFTVVPVHMYELDRDAARRAILALPWLGLVLGALAGLVAAGVVALGDGALLAAATALAVLALVTGAMHLDGLADTADGLGSRKPPGQAVGIMKKSDVGPMGVATLVLVVLLEVGALASPRISAYGWWALTAAVAGAAMTGRLLALSATTAASPAAHGSGFAQLFSGVTSRRSLVLSTAAVGLVDGGLGFGASGLRGLLVFVGAGIVAWCVGWFWRRRVIRRLGGVNGDVWGSLIELGQLAFVFVVALAL